MNAWLGQHVSAMRLAMGRLLVAPVNTLLSLMAMGIALALPVGGLVVFFQAQQLVGGTGALPQISVFAKLDASRKAASEVGLRIKQNPATKSVEFLPREETLTRMRKKEGLADVIDALPRNPFPDAFVVTPVDSDAQAMEQLAAQFRALPQVEQVQIDSAWVRRLNAMLRLAQTILEILAVLLGAGLLAITFNTVRLQILTRRSEIEISQLLGATDAYIRRPFFYFGALQGLVGGAVAWAIVSCGILAIRQPLGNLAMLYGYDLSIHLPGLLMTSTLLVAAGALGWLGTALSLGQHLRGDSTRNAN